jgi:predicted lipid-binding transport protein (Tim44 family)
VFDTTTILLLAVAVLIFLKLRSVLGQRTGRERPPYDPYSAADPVRNSSGDKVVALPQRPSESARPAESAELPDRYVGFATPGSVVARGLDAIAAVDKNFDVKQFIAGARAAYEMIVTAYAVGDRRSLKNLLAREVYDGFESVIREREAKPLKPDLYRSTQPRSLTQSCVAKWRISPSALSRSWCRPPVIVTAM